VAAQRLLNASASSTQAGAQRRRHGTPDLDELASLLDRVARQAAPGAQTSDSDNSTRRQANKRDRPTSVRGAGECTPGQSGGACAQRSPLAATPAKRAPLPAAAGATAADGLHLGAQLAVLLLLAGFALVGLATAVDYQTTQALEKEEELEATTKRRHEQRRAGAGAARHPSPSGGARFFLDLGPQANKLRDYRSLSISSNCSSNLFCSANSVASSSAPILAAGNRHHSNINLHNYNHHHHNLHRHHHHHHQSQQQHLQAGTAQTASPPPQPLTHNQYESNLQLHLSQAGHEPGQLSAASLDGAKASRQLVASSKLATKAEKPATPRGLAHQILMAFSLRQTVSQIFEHETAPAEARGNRRPRRNQNTFADSYKRHSSEAAGPGAATSGARESVDSLHGLRFFSMIWVIIIHSYNFALRWMFFSNTSTLDGIYKSAASQFIANGSFACDSFFFVGGFLLPYLAMRPTDTSPPQPQSPTAAAEKSAGGSSHDTDGYYDDGIEDEDDYDYEGDEDEEERDARFQKQQTDRHDQQQVAVVVAPPPADNEQAALACCCRPASACSGRQTSEAAAPTPDGAALGAPFDCCQGRAASASDGYQSAERLLPAQSCACEQQERPLSPVSGGGDTATTTAKRHLAPHTNELPPSVLASDSQAGAEPAPEQRVHERVLGAQPSAAGHVAASNERPSSSNGSRRRHRRNDGRRPLDVQFTWRQCAANVARRYMRMMPLMMAIIGLCVSLLRYMGDGPVWHESTMMYDHWCRQNWWLNAVFLHNFVNRENMCLSHSWYSAVDFQLFLVGQLILYALHRSRRWGLTLLLGLLFVSPVVTMLLTLRHHLPAVPLVSSVDEQTMNLYYGQIYIKPYSRASPYLIGILLAYLMRTTSLAEWRLKRVSTTTGMNLSRAPTRQQHPS
jgi:hypothetical protein